MDTHKLYSWLRRHDAINAGVHREGEQEEDQLHRPLLGDIDDQLGHVPQDARLLPEDHDDDQASQVRLPLDDQRAAVQRQMPPSLAMFTGKQSLIRNGLYTYLDKNGRAQRAKRTSPSKKYMLPILDNLNRLDTMLDAPFNLADEDNIQNCFHDIIVACENYLDNRNPWTREGKARKQMIRDFYEQVKYESVGFAGIVANMRSGAAAGAAVNTWIDVISQIRTQTFVDGAGGVTITEGGAGTSKLYIVEKNGVKKYFKQNETIPPRHCDEILGEQKAKLRQDDVLYQASAHTDAEKADNTARVNRRIEGLDLFRKYLFQECMNNEQNVYEYLNEHIDSGDLLQVMIASFSRHSDFINYITPLVQERTRLSLELDDAKAEVASASDANAKQAAETRLKAKKKEFDSCDLEYLYSSVIQIKKDMLSHFIAVGDAKIDPSSELSKRNVATTRMARLLGLSGMIAGSNMAEVVINGISMRGIIMDDAPGHPAFEIDEAHARPAMYSATVFRQLLNLQIFDIVCGQVDRHMGNYLCREDASSPTHIKLTDIMAIDHDMSFGTLSYKDIKERGTYGLNRIRNIEVDGELKVPVIDYDLYDRLRNITQEQINYEMCDILSKEERKALFDRISGVKKAIEKRAKYEARYSRDPNFTSTFIGKPGNTITWNSVHQRYINHIASWRQRYIQEGDAEEQKLMAELNAERAQLTQAEYDAAEQDILDQCDEIRATADTQLAEISYLHLPYLLGTA